MTDPYSIEPRCRLSDLHVSQCAHCRPPVDEPIGGHLDTYSAQPMSFAARYDGFCSGPCKTTFNEGDLIVRDDDGTYRHADCKAAYT
jgi:hypothetical protein